MKFVKLLPDTVATTLQGKPVNIDQGVPLLLTHIGIILDRIASPELSKTIGGVATIIKVQETCQDTEKRKLPYLALEDAWHEALRKECEKNDLDRLPPMYPMIAHNYQPYLQAVLDATDEEPEELKNARAQASAQEN